MQLIGAILLTNAGGGRNLLASRNNGKTWTVLDGSFGRQACYHGKFLVLGDRVFMGGECPLDDAYLLTARLRPDFSGFVSAPVAVDAPELSNRNVQFITASPRTGVLFAGVEGGLLRSTDGGKRWHFVIEYTLDSDRYPYVQALSAIGAKDDLLVGGFDKPNGSAFLAYSRDGGRSWTDATKSLLAASRATEVSFIDTEPGGRVILGAWDEQSRVLHTFAVELK
jgi:hypothetical protein